MPRDIYLGIVYLSPFYFEHKYNFDYISDLENDLFTFSNLGEILLMGDFNARTGNLQDFVDNNKILTNGNLDVFDYSAKPVVSTKRNSQDFVSNNRGEKLIELCLSFDLFILNGRKLGDSFGAKTCFNWNGSSVVDYVISSIPLYESVRYLQVGDLHPTYSIHCPVTFGMNLQVSYPEKIKDIELQIQMVGDVII